MANLDRGQLVGYIPEEKQLIVTISDKTAEKMQADNWDIKEDEDLGFFIVIKMEE